MPVSTCIRVATCHSSALNDCGCDCCGCDCCCCCCRRAVSVLQYPAGMFVGGKSKKENQDDYFVSAIGVTPSANVKEMPVEIGGDFVAGALDGHGMHGKTVSNFCRKKLHARLLSERALNMPPEAYGGENGPMATTRSATSGSLRPVPLPVVSSAHCHQRRALGSS